MKKVKLFNYLLNKNINDKIKMDSEYYLSEDYISFSKKWDDLIIKRRYILNNIFGIMIEKYEKL